MKDVYVWVLRAGILIILGTSMYYVNSLNSNLVSELKQKTQSLEQAPLDKLQEITMQTEINRRGDDIKNIKSFIVDRNNLVKVISYVEEVAKERLVTVQVPNIEERIIIDPATGEEVPATGPLEDLMVDINVNGDPDDIVKFLYDLEHSPYLLRLESWQVSVNSTTTDLLTGDGLSAPEDKEVEAPKVEGQATIKAVVTVWRSDDKVE